MTIKKILYFISILFLVKYSFGQIDTLNKLNSKGKKTGYWKVFLNEKADPVKNATESYFYGLEFWDDGKQVTSFNKHRWKFKRLIIDSALPSKKGNPVPISGTFKWYDQKDRLLAEEIYLAGLPLSFKSYNGHNTEVTFNLMEYLDYTKKYNNMTGSFYVELHHSNGLPPEKYWFRKGNKGWKSYKILE